MLPPEGGKESRETEKSFSSTPCRQMVGRFKRKGTRIFIHFLYSALPHFKGVKNPVLLFFISNDVYGEWDTHLFFIAHQISVLNQTSHYSQYYHTALARPKREMIAHPLSAPSPSPLEETHQKVGYYRMLFTPSHGRAWLWFTQHWGLSFHCLLTLPPEGGDKSREIKSTLLKQYPGESGFLKSEGETGREESYWNELLAVFS